MIPTWYKIVHEQTNVSLDSQHPTAKYITASLPVSTALQVLVASFL